MTSLSWSLDLTTNIIKQKDKYFLGVCSQTKRHFRERWWDIVIQVVVLMHESQVLEKDYNPPFHISMFRDISMDGNMKVTRKFLLLLQKTTTTKKTTTKNLER